VGVAIIDGKDICSACNRAVPPQLCIQVMKGQIIESCPACMRLLVHHSMTQAPAAGETHG
jgi:predicted  nucleic acid-binding Zn-ribbon protein